MTIKQPSSIPHFRHTDFHIQSEHFHIPIYTSCFIILFEMCRLNEQARSDRGRHQIVLAALGELLQRWPGCAPLRRRHAAAARRQSGAAGGAGQSQRAGQHRGHARPPARRAAAAGEVSAFGCVPFEVMLGLHSIIHCVLASLS